MVFSAASRVDAAGIGPLGSGTRLTTALTTGFPSWSEISAVNVVAAAGKHRASHSAAIIAEHPLPMTR
jgi:hypothetical protein